MALFVNETTLLPVLAPLAPAASVVDRFRKSVEEVLGAHGASASFIEAEMIQMTEHLLAATKNRSVVGVMNEFARLGEEFGKPADVPDLEALGMWLSRTPVRGAVRQPRQP